MKILQLNHQEKICFALLASDPLFTGLGIPMHFTLVDIVYAIAFTFYCRERNFRKIIISVPLIIWFLLTVYQYSNAIIKGVPLMSVLNLFHGFKIYACLCIFSYWASIDFSKTIKCLVKCFILDLFVILAFSDMSTGRLSGVMWATGLGQLAAFIGVYIAYYVALNKISFSKILRLYSLPFIIIILTQSRNSLGILGITLLASIIAYYTVRGKFFSTKNLMFMLFFAILLLILSPYVMDSAFLQRAMEAKEASEDSFYMQENATGTIFDDIVGDRLYYYLTGWELFLKHPLTGIGLYNFQFITGGDFPLHTEYMVHLCEGGLIAACLWLAFLYNVLKGIIYFKENYLIKIIALVSIISLLFCGIYAREFYTEFFYPVYGVALSLTFTRKIFHKSLLCKV